MLRRVRKFTINHRLMLYTIILLFLATAVTGFSSYELAKVGLNRRGETILKNGVKAALMVIEQKQEDVDLGYIPLKEAQEQVKELLLGPMQADGTRPIQSPIDLGANGYFIVYSTTGEEIMHPILEGQNVWDVVDLDPMGGDFLLVQDKIKKALAGGGFTTYAWSVPFEDTIRKKIVYSEYDPKWGWVVTAGSYINDFNREAQNILFVTIGVAVIVLLAGYLAASRYINSITGPLINLEETMKRAKHGNYITLEPLKRLDEIGSLYQGYNAMITAIKDATERLKQKDETLHSYAYFDTLTGLPNKFSIKEYIDTRLRETPGQCHFVLMDIKDFKLINSVYGGDYGDFILKQIACVLKEHAHDNLVFARLAGNEFAAWIEDVTDQRIIELIENFKGYLSQHLVKEGAPHHLEYHFSCSGNPEFNKSFDDYYQHASIALQHAKDNNVMEMLCFKEDMYSSLERSSQIKDFAERAIRNKEFFLQYQQKVNSATGEIVGVEALARWHHKELGVISPGEFIPLLNRTHLIHSFTEFVLLQALDDLPRIQAKYGSQVSVSINISPNVFFMSNFEILLKAAITERRIDPSHVYLEITEDVFIGDLKMVQQIIMRLQAFGVRISLDDFGTGYSSLNYIANIPLDEIKIDKQFIDRIHLDDKSRLLLKSIVDIAHGLDCMVVAEGVEHPEQLDVLSAVNCIIIQGYIYSKPESLS